jgi:hypothetical protein
MCYEFAHSCNDLFLNKIAASGGEKYFLICIGNLNYLFSDDQDTIENIRGVLFLENVVPHIITEEDLNDVLLVGETITFQKFHGNKTLYKSFLSRTKK